MTRLRHPRIGSGICSTTDIKALLFIGIGGSLLIGLVGAPNKGKSTLFSAMTSVEAQIADYAFTTIRPNLGVAYVGRECAEVGLGVKCNPRNSVCMGGVRRLPVNIVDVAGLVPGAHLGKGMGNQFLNDLIGADALIEVVDLSGRTGINGSRTEGSDPADEVRMVRDEMAEWLAGIISRHMPKLSKRTDGDSAMAELLSGLRATPGQIRDAAERSYLSLSAVAWDRDATRRFAAELLRINKPMVVAANKMDQAPDGALERLREKLPGTHVCGCSAAMELALVKAAARGIIDYSPGAAGFSVIKSVDPEQKGALEYMKGYLASHGSTGVSELINEAVFGMLGKIVVYPVEDDGKYTDHSGNVLPDALIMDAGATAYDLAARIHSDIAKSMKYAVDARRKMRLQKEYALKDGDVIRIVGTR